MEKSRMKRINKALLPCLWFVVWSAWIQAASAQEAAPVIEIENPTYEFQQVTEGDVVKHDFRVFNRGNAPLEIKKVKPG